MPEGERLLAALIAAAIAAVDELAQPEDHELRRLDGADADLADDLAGLDGLGLVVLRVALYEERLIGRRAEQRSAAPHHRQEVRHRRAQLQPQPLVVGLEDRP